MKYEVVLLETPERKPSHSDDGIAMKHLYETFEGRTLCDQRIRDYEVVPAWQVAARTYENRQCLTCARKDD